MFKNGFTLLLGVVLAFVLVGCGGEGNSGNNNDGSSSSGGAKTLRLAHVGSDTHQYQIGAEKFKEIVERETDGAIQIEIFNNGVLGNEGEVVEQVIDGTVDITSVIADSSFANTVPVMNVFGIPYLFEDLEHVYATLDGEIGEELLAEVSESGMKPLGFWDVGFRHLTNSVKEVVTPEDAQGLSIRVQPSKVWDAHMEALGISATPLGFNELYSAMDQGTVDGQENPLNTIYSMKFQEVQPYLSLTGHTFSPGMVVMSEDAWGELTEEQQEVVESAFAESVVYQREEMERINGDILNALEEEGVTITEPDVEAFREATKDVKDVLSEEVPAELIERIESLR